MHLRSSITVPLLLCSQSLWAQYTVQILPTPNDDGLVNGAGGGQIVGAAFGAGGGPALWDGPNHKYVSLRPKGYSGAEVWGVGGGRQVGYGVTGGSPHALMWSGSAGSVVDLDTPMFFGTFAYGTDGKSQVGSGGAEKGGNNSHAVLWRGTAGSAVDLHPAGYENSEARDVQGNIQVGSVAGGPGNSGGGAIWKGTAGSMQLLPVPKGHTPGGAFAIGGDQIVGSTSVTGNGHAVLWDVEGTSVIDLTPIGGGATAFDTNGTQQVGQAGFGEGPRAVVWSGTAESMVNLHDFLPNSILESHAFGILEDGTIAGWGTTLAGDVPIIWTPVPEPAPIAALAIGLLALCLKRRASH
jgi:hypothetical protein